MVAQIKIVELSLFHSSQHSGSKSMHSDGAWLCMCVCVHACFHISACVELLPHLIFYLVSVWQLYAVNNIEHSHNQSNETHAGFFLDTKVGHLW